MQRRWSTTKLTINTICFGIFPFWPQSHLDIFFLCLFSDLLTLDEDIQTHSWSFPRLLLTPTSSLEFSKMSFQKQERYEISGTRLLSQNVKSVGRLVVQIFFFDPQPYRPVTNSRHDHFPLCSRQILPQPGLRRYPGDPALSRPLRLPGHTLLEARSKLRHPIPGRKARPNVQIWFRDILSCLKKMCADIGGGGWISPLHFKSDPFPQQHFYFCIK